MAKHPDPEATGEHTELTNLILQENPKPVVLLMSFSNLFMLKELDARAWKISGSISDFEKLSSLEDLNLGHNNFCSLPSSLQGLSVLKNLFLPHCKEINSLPPLPSSLIKLNVSNCCALQSVSDLSNLKSLEDLNLTNCKKIMDIPGLQCLKSLKRFYASGCNACLPALKSRITKVALKHLYNLSVPGSEIPNWFVQEIPCFSSHRNLKVTGVVIGVVVCVSVNPQMHNAYSDKVPVIVDVQAKLFRRNEDKPVHSTTLKLEGVADTNEDQLYLCRFLDFKSLVLMLKDGDKIQVAVRDKPLLLPKPKMTTDAVSSTPTASTPAVRRRWDVFLSFRGEDTRGTFTDCLYTRLQHKGVRAFRDNEGLNRGDKIDRCLLDAIEDSAAFIAIISPNYANSRWCLEELAKVCECNRLILPVFYNVDPSHVRGQRGPFLQHFKDLEARFGEEDVSKWRKAMKYVGGLAGFFLSIGRFGDEADVIQTLLNNVLAELSKWSGVAAFTVGLDSRVEEVLELLDLKSNSIRVLGLYGPGGVGKSTLAKALYNKLVAHFENRSFISNVKKYLAQENGLLSLQIKLIGDLSGMASHVNEVNAGLVAIKSIVLHELHENELYEVKQLNSPESLQLFSHYALGRVKPTPDYLPLSKQIVSLTGGLPLALEVFGSSFEILRVLQNNLGSRCIQGMVLDFVSDIFMKDSAAAWGRFRGTPNFTTAVTWLKETYKEYFQHAAEKERELILQTKSFESMINLRLLQIDNVQLEGEFKLMPAELKWLQWRGCPLKTLPSDFCPQGLRVLDLSESKNIERLWGGRWWSWHNNKVGENLMVMNLHGCCNLTAIPDLSGNQALEKLILQHCHGLVKIHKSIGDIISLLHLDLSECKNLVEFPSDVSGLKNLQTLILSGCSKLKELPENISYMKSLRELLLDGTVIEKLPESVLRLTRLERLSLNNCHPVNELPASIVLGAEENSELIVLPTSFSNLSLLYELDARAWKISGKIPDDFDKLSSLEILNLGRNNFSSLPSSLRGLSILRKLLLPHCEELKALPPLPSSLMEVNAANCYALEVISDLSNLESLQELNLTNCKKLVDIPGVECLKSLKGFFMSGCSSCSSTVKRRLSKVALKNLRTLSIPGSNIPDWFSRNVAIFSKRKNLVIKAVIIGVVVSLSHHIQDELRDQLPSVPGIEAKILRMNRQVFGTMLDLTGVPKTDEDHLYLCRYREFHPIVSMLKDGDKIQVTMRNPPMVKGVELKKSGIHLIFENDDDYDEDERSFDENLQTVSEKIARFFGPSEGGNSISDSIDEVEREKQEMGMKEEWKEEKKGRDGSHRSSFLLFFFIALPSFFLLLSWSWTRG
ncbi:unnamed protein product, partial [Vitis vinifera]